VRSPAPRRRLARDDGYTLVEMLVVIAIIALIAAVLTPQLLGQLSRARAKTGQLQVETVASAVELFRSDVGRYPTASEGLNALIADPGAEGWTGPYLKDPKAVFDPWNHALLYQPTSDGEHFAVVSLGADGKEGGTSADRDIRAPASATTTTAATGP
jgi:general secretion pathway protein G